MAAKSKEEEAGSRLVAFFFQGKAARRKMASHAHHFSCVWGVVFVEKICSEICTVKIYQV